MTTPESTNAPWRRVWLLLPRYVWVEGYNNSRRRRWAWGGYWRRPARRRNGWTYAQQPYAQRDYYLMAQPFR